MRWSPIALRQEMAQSTRRPSSPGLAGRNVRKSPREPPKVSGWSTVTNFAGSSVVAMPTFSIAS